jgi:2',3'-cyclic-nucleotide 2'-phosphodiesterase (5'-nucleotidase family)
MKLKDFLFLFTLFLSGWCAQLQGQSTTNSANTISFTILHTNDLNTSFIGMGGLKKEQNKQKHKYKKLKNKLRFTILLLLARQP